MDIAHKLRDHQPRMIGEVLGLVKGIGPGTRLVQEQHDTVAAVDDPLSDALDLLGKRHGAIAENVGLSVDASRILKPAGDLR